MTPTNTRERLYCILWMFFGCMSYSFIVSSLYSYINNVDKKDIKYKQNLNTLFELKKEHNIGINLINRIKKALKYDAMKYFFFFSLFLKIILHFNDHRF